MTHARVAANCAAPALAGSHPRQGLMQISAIQCDVEFGQPDQNLATLRSRVREEASAGSRLLVFPECFATGYCCSSLEEARQFAQPVDGPFAQAVIAECREHNCFVVFGMLESAGNDVFNAAVLVGPDGVVGSYRKVHIPFLGVDRFTTPGNRPFEIFDIDGLKIGMLICYDGGFPESVRELALRHADLVVLPTNWPPGAETMAEYAVNTRAMENAVYFLAANRIGEERGFRFIGTSRICDPAGNTMAAANGQDDCVIRATVDVKKSRQKRITRVPGEHIIDRFADRRPEMYSQLTQPHSLPRPGRDD